MDLVGQTECAIKAFYQSEVANERKSAHQWLLELQRSSEGWLISWGLLDTTKAMEVQYYGAIILYSKVSNNLCEQDKSDLNQKLLGVMHAFSSGPTAVYSKLCQTYASLILQTATIEFKLRDCLESIQKAFEEKNLNGQLLILEILTALPREFKDQNILSRDQKYVARDMLNCFKPILLSMALQVFKGSDIKYQNEILCCLLSWIGYFYVSIAEAEELIPVLFSKILCDELSEKVFEVLIELINTPESHRCHVTIFKLVKYCIGMENIIDKAFNEEDDDLLHQLCLFFTNLADTHSSTLLQAKSKSQSDFLKLVHIIIRFTSAKGDYPTDEVLSELTFGFWYSLQEAITILEKLNDFQKQFIEAYVVLLDIFFQKCQFTNNYNKYTSEEKELFRCYRIDIQDNMLYVHMLLGKRCMLILADKLNKLLAEKSSTWQQFEALFHLLQGASESLDTEDCDFLPQILSKLAEVPSHPQVLNTVVLFIGSLSEWLNLHPEYIKVVLPFLLKGIEIQDTSVSCSISLKDICRECAMLLDEQSIASILQTCKVGIQQKSSAKLTIRLFEIAGFVVSAMQPEPMSQHLHCFVLPLLQWLQQLLKDDSKSKDTVTSVVENLNIFTALFRSLDPFEHQAQHPIAAVYAQLSPLFQHMGLLLMHEEVVVALCECVKKAIEVVREELQEFVPLTSSVLSSLFKHHPYSCVLDVSTVLIGMFSRTKIQSDVFCLFENLRNACFVLIESNEGSQQPDTMQSFMNLCFRVIKIVPEFILNEKVHNEKIFQCALSLITSQETLTIKGVCNFFSAYVNASYSYESSRELVERMGVDLFRTVLLCIAGASPRQSCEHFVEIILALNKKYLNFLTGWFEQLFKDERFPSSIPSKNDRQKFQKIVLKERTNKRNLKTAVEEFSVVCRGLQGTGYVL